MSASSRGNGNGNNTTQTISATAAAKEYLQRIRENNQEKEAKENQKLKKQLEEANEKILLLQASEPMLEYKKALEENQQKDFIEYLTSYIELLSDDPDYVEERQKDILEEILSKYKEIIR